MTEQDSTRMQTGIPGLDRILEGGFPRGGCYIVQGAPGTGKTILGNQIAFHQAARGEDVLFVTLLAESHTRMIRHLRRMNFFEPSLIPDRLHYISAFKVLQEQGTDGLLTSFRQEAQKRKPTLLVVDGLVSAEEAAGSPRQFKMFIHELQTAASFLGYTVLLLTNSVREKSVQVEHTMVDGVLELTDELRGLRTLRHLRVLKLRGSRPVPGQHTLQISDEGIAVRPRIETELQVGRSTGGPEAPSETRRAFGCPELDAMLCGGPPDRSVTMVVGPSGSGKSILGLRFLAEGARQGQPGVHFSFYEKPDQLLTKAKRLGFADAFGEGTVELVWERAIEGVIDVLGERLLAAVRRTGAKRVVIDSIQGFEFAADHPERVRDVLSALSDELDALGVTTIYTAETKELLGSPAQVPMSGISAITHNIVLLRFLEQGARLVRVVSVIKVRDSDFDPTVRELVIEEGRIDAVAGTLEESSAAPNPAARSGGRSKQRT